MIYAIVAAVWIALGYAALIWNSYTEKEPFLTQRRSYEEDEYFPALGVVALGGVSFLWLVTKRIQCAAITAGKEKRLIAEELEKELMAARREIDAMLKRERAK